MNYRLPGSSVHGISQARILEWVAIIFSRGPSQPGMEPVALQYAESNVSSEKETQTYRTDFGTLWEKARVGWSERIALKHVYYQLWNRSPVQVWCMRQVLRAGALGWPRGMGWGGRWEGGSGWGTHVNAQLIHINVWQKPLQYCKVISLQLI